MLVSNPASRAGDNKRCRVDETRRVSRGDLPRPEREDELCRPIFISGPVVMSLVGRRSAALQWRRRERAVS